MDLPIGTHYLFTLFLIYIGTVFYVIASYYHLQYKESWNFFTVLGIAIPLVILEYFFSLHGNHYAHFFHHMTPLDILIITMCFYFINLWLLNFFVLKNNKHNPYSETIAFALVIAAFVISNVVK
jgi:hypothetical protein